jgi:hypothetical protein
MPCTVKDGERYRTSEDVLDAFWRACCMRCIHRVRRGATLAGLYPET